jgi:DNA helicase-2/ATP-dependent DNA helicase PcrA
LCAELVPGNSGSAATADPGSTLEDVGHQRIFQGLNSEQRRAVEAVRGPVCILAGAGSGKTTTITRRVANQVATGAFSPREILAVTFTDKAAGEMRSRLEALGVTGVEARTFHSAAYAQLRAFAAEPPGSVLPSKALMLRHIANRLPLPFRFRPAGDLATEIEWAKNRRLAPATYRRGLDGHEPPIPVDLMERVFAEYERRKTALGKIDFEDLLEHAIRLLDDPHARASIHERYRSFTVDEYQDVNLLQQTLLERWAGDRDDLCVVGDDYQAIYSFIGATPAHLLAVPERFRHATVVRLEANHRSTPEILALANRLVPRLGGAEKTLRATLPAASKPILRALGGAEEPRFVIDRIRELVTEGVAFREMAILYRTNARSAAWEEALTEAEIPFVVRAGAFLERQAARRLLRALRGSESTRVALTVRELAEQDGLLVRPHERLGEQEAVRQADLRRLVALARELDDGVLTLGGFAEELRRRYGREAETRGVNLLTYHAAKGLEFDAVFLPRLEERELPIKQARSPDAVDEERRLLYVGMTRARYHLCLTWSAGGKPSRFLGELGVEQTGRAPKRPGDEELEQPAFRALRTWRLERAKADGVPAFVVFHDSTLAEIVRRAPGSAEELAVVPGVGPTKLARYAREVLAALRSAS